MCKKNSKHCRILFQNPGGIGVTPGVKFELWKEYIKENKVDIAGLAEVNVNWKKVRDADRLGDRLKGWFESQRVVSAYNKGERSEERGQVGGTGVVVTNKLSYCVSQTGQDPRGLGRWCWARIRGKNKVSTRIITVYRPASPASPSGPNTNYAQQIRGLAREGITECPIKQFWVDLVEELKVWRAAGEQLIVMGDFNEDTDIVEKRLASLHLKDVLRARHDSPLPPTHQRGSVPIDGILATPTLAATMSCGGYLAFGTLLGDHRGVWMDVPLSAMLGYDMANVSSPQARRLKLEDPRVVHKYQMLLLTYCRDNDLFIRAHNLRRRSVYPLPPELQREYEALDAIRVNGMNYAERHCRKLKMGAIPWSPQYKAARDTVYLWNLVVKKMVGCHVHARKIIKLRRRLNIPTTLLSLEDARSKLEEALVVYKELKQDAKELRLSHLDSLAEAQAEEGNVKVASKLRELKHRERQRIQNRVINSVTTDDRNNGTTKAEIEHSDGTKEVLTEKLDLEKAIVEENESKYHQIDLVCPLTNGQLLRDIGWFGEGPCVDDILKGTYHPPQGTDKDTKEFLREIGHSCVDPLPPQTIKEYRSAWKVCRERTASGDSAGLHFGHFMACSRHDALNWLNFVLAEIPETSGYSPARYKKVIDLMLLKEPNNFLLKKLRTIVLFQADSNMTNKRLGRESMWSAVGNGLIAAEQYSRPRRNAIDHVLNRRLVFDTSRQLKQSFAMCSCDLKNCYDRIAHNAASLALQRVGVSRAKIVSMFSTIQNMTHTVRTAYGDATQAYGGAGSSYAHPPQGACQGNGAGPAMWSVLSSTVFSIMRKHGYGMNFCSAISRKVFSLCGFAYVDDSDLIQSGRDPTVVAEDMQKALAKWESLMKVNGGVLAPAKSWWYLVDYKWKNGKWSYVDAGNTLELRAKDMNGIISPLKYLNHTEAKEMLGVFLSPDGNNCAQLKAMGEVRDAWMDRLRLGVLTGEDAWLAFHTRVWKKLEYSLPSLTLSKKECAELMSPLLQQTLSQAGICSTIPVAVRHGPVMGGGLGLPDMYIRQGTMRVQKLVEHLWLQTPTGQLLCTALEGLQLDVGIESPVLSMNHGVYGSGLSDSSWLVHTWQFMSEHSIRYEGATASLSPLRQQDCALMEVLLTSGYTAAECRTLNRCRLYLQVVFVSELATADGKDLWAPSLLGERRRCLNTYVWPHQARPPKRDWLFWADAIRRHFATGLTRLSTPLGAWLESPAGWEWWFLPSHASLYRSVSDQEVHRCECTRGTRIPIYSSSLVVKVPGVPPNCIPATVDHELTSVKLLSTGEVHQQSQDLDSPRSRRQRLLDSLREHSDGKWIAEELSCSLDIDLLIRDLLEGRAVAVSDGPYNPRLHLGSAAWIIESWCGTQYLRGAGMLPGSIADQNAYRSEIGGQYGIALGVWALAQLCSLTAQSKIYCACDGSSALQRCHLKMDSIGASMKQFDLLSAVTEIWEALPIRVVPVHVYGHRDETGVELNRLEMMNVEMDCAAKAMMSIFLASRRPRPSRQNTRPGMGRLTIEGVEVHSKLQSTLEGRIVSGALEEYWLERRPSFQDYAPDWEAFGRARREVPLYTQHFVTKWMTGFLPTNRVLVKRRQRTFRKCHICGHYEEDNLHVATCWHKSSKAVWKGLLLQLEQWLRTRHTDTDLTFLILDGLATWRARPHTHRTYDEYQDREIRESARRIQRWGWLSVLEGCIDPEWSEIQQRHYNAIDSRRTGHRWAVDFIKQVWQILVHLWLHRNKKLHEVESAQKDLNGWPSLERAVTIECSRGVDVLPHHFAQFFREEADVILARPLDKVKRWYALVKGGRENTGSDWPNEFSRKGALRTWVGLYSPPQA